jgi:fumarate reductase subunit D
MKPATHSVQINGRVQFPRLCPYCGGFAEQTLPISHSFARKYTTRTKNNRKVRRTYYDTPTFWVPFCTHCIAIHEAEVIRPTWRHYGRQAFVMLQYVPIAGLMIFFIITMWSDWLQRGTITLANALGSGVFFLAGVVLPLYVALRRSHHYVISPPTSITRVVSFGDRERLSVWSSARTFRFRHATYAQQFAAENGERVLTSPSFETLKAS